MTGFRGLMEQRLGVRETWASSILDGLSALVGAALFALLLFGWSLALVVP